MHSAHTFAAIQQDMPTPLDFNRELITVGISNTVVGALGVGYTGSYIFSQTVFTMRAGGWGGSGGWVWCIGWQGVGQLQAAPKYTLAAHVRMSALICIFMCLCVQLMCADSRQ